MRQKRRHTWTVSFVEVPLGPLRAGGAPESTKQPRYPGTEGQGRGVCLVPRTSAPAGARPPSAGPLTVAAGDVAVAPVNALLGLGHVAPRLHIAIRVPGAGRGSRSRCPRTRPARPVAPQLWGLRALFPAAGGKPSRPRGQSGGSARPAPWPVLPAPPRPRRCLALEPRSQAEVVTSVRRGVSSRPARSLLLQTAVVSLNPKPLGHRSWVPLNEAAGHRARPPAPETAFWPHPRGRLQCPGLSRSWAPGPDARQKKV